MKKELIEISKWNGLTNKPEKLFFAALGRNSVGEKSFRHFVTTPISDYDINRKIVFSGQVSKSIDDKGFRVYRSKKTGFYHLYVKTDSLKRSAICVINPEIFEKSNIRLKKGGRCKVKKFNLTVENSLNPSY